MPKENNNNPETNQDPRQDIKHGYIRSRPIEDEMQQSYLDYAMSVIVSRALPDVRDGLKPVHRRILYSMHELGLRHNAKYKKCATVVGDVLGKYHPHGDMAVYDSLVRMAQDFSLRYPLIDGQGNFGSMDGDSAAAYRYTEARMQEISEEMLADLEKETVDFMDNFDGTKKEPRVLPAKIPNLLLNGSEGIAVGMATKIPPHNLKELADAVVFLVDNPECGVEELMNFIPGPDFPTGASIYNAEEIRQAYTTGKGKVVMRAEAKIEEGKRTGEFRIIVTELPFQVNKASLVEKIATLVKDKKIIGISDIRDESDKEGIRVVIELKKDAYPQKILNSLYKLTPMQDSFHVNMLALVDGIQPRILNLKEVLNLYIKHRQEVVKRRTQYELTKAKERLHILEGLKIALDHLDAVISTIRKSKDKEEAKINLIKKFKLSDLQAQAILDMRLSALAALERKKVEDEYKEKKKLIKELESILADPKKILKIIKEEALAVKEKYGDERRTKIFKKKIGEFKDEDLVPNEEVIVTLSEGGYIKRMPTNTYRTQSRGGKGVIGASMKEEDVIAHITTAMTHDYMLFFTNKGRVFLTRVFEIPAASRIAKGQAIVNLIEIKGDEKVTAMISLDSFEKEGYMFMITKGGTVKKTAIVDYKNVRRSGLIAIRLDEHDELDWIRITSGRDEIIIVSADGQSIRFKEEDVRPMGRAARGVRGIKLREKDYVVGVGVITKDNQDKKLLVVTENGMGKKTKLAEYGVQNRGGVGIKTANVTEKTGKIVSAKVVGENKADLLCISKGGQVIRIPLKDISTLGRSTQGVRIMRLSAGDKIASVSVIEEEEDQEVKGSIKPAYRQTRQENLPAGRQGKKTKKQEEEGIIKIKEEVRRMEKKVQKPAESKIIKKSRKVEKKSKKPAKKIKSKVKKIEKRGKVSSKSKPKKPVKKSEKKKTAKPKAAKGSKDKKPKKSSSGFTMRKIR